MPTHDSDALVQRLDQLARRSQEHDAFDDPLKSFLRAVASKGGRGDVSVETLEAILERVIQQAEHTASPEAIALMKEIALALARFESGETTEAELRMSLSAIAETPADG